MHQVLIKGGYGGRIDVAEGEILEAYPLSAISMN
jgi:hypothetical protein